MKALSIRQPWAWLIANGYKDIENRTWSTEFRGRFYIHTGKYLIPSEYVCLAESIEYRFGISCPKYYEVDFGGIVGIAELVDCVQESSSLWFQGPFGLVIQNAGPLPFYPMSGKLGLFDVKVIERVHGGIDETL